MNNAIVESYDESTKALNTNSKMVDASNNGISSTNVSGKQSVDVNVTSITLNSDDDSVSVVEQKLVKRVDSSNASYTYIGEAVAGSSVAGALWSIKRITLSPESELGTTLYADGVTTKTKIWDNRSLYSYS